MTENEFRQLIVTNETAPVFVAASEPASVLPTARVMTGIGPVTMRCPRVRVGLAKAPIGLFSLEPRTLKISRTTKVIEDSFATARHSTVRAEGDPRCKVYRGLRSAC